MVLLGCAYSLLACRCRKRSAENGSAVEEDGGDSVVGVQRFQGRFCEQEKVGDFAWFDGTELRIESEFTSIIDGGGLKDLRE